MKHNKTFALLAAGLALSLAGCGSGDTQAGAQEQAKQLVQSRTNNTNMVPPDQYQKLMAGARGVGRKKG